MTNHWTPFEIVTGTVAGLLCIAFACVSLEAADIETGLARRALEALQDTGLHWAAVEPQGRRLVLSGGATDGETTALAVARVAGLPGVAGVDNRIVAIGPAAVCQARLDATRDGRGVKFRKGQAELAPASGALLAELAATLNGCDARVEVAVHAEPGGNAGVAQALTQRRADRIARRLVELGVAIDRVVATGYGTRQPVGAQQRVEFRVLGAAT
jgi:outer membrane protein OmpA-like peptidoglycan-associated protein